MDCKKEKNLENCKCTYLECSRKGICCECIKYHREENELPACYFTLEAERTCDRSIEKFIKDR